MRRQVKWCPNCKRHWNRDTNAARNIAINALAVANNEPVRVRFRRSPYKRVERNPPGSKKLKRTAPAGARKDAAALCRACARFLAFLFIIIILLSTYLSIYLSLH